MPEWLLGHSLWAWRSGELAFGRGWPLWLLIVLLAVALALVVASFFWPRSAASAPPLALWRRIVLGLLQWLFFAILLVALWRPVLNVERIRDRENVVAVLVDDSGSMNAIDAGETATRRQQAAAALGKGVLARIAAGSELRLFAFSDRATSVEDLAALQGGAPQTRIGEALRAVLQMASSVPLAAVVLVSDGAETGDTLTEADLAQIAATGVPVHAVGVGPERFTNDLELESLELPRTAIAGETLRAQLSIRHQRQGATRVRVYDGGQLVAAQEVKLDPQSTVSTVRIDIPAGRAGLRDLRVQLDAGEGETNEANNARRALVEVTDRRRRILYIEGEPRWEYKFIRRAVEQDRTLRLAGVMRATPNRYYRQGVDSAAELDSGFPRTQAELFAFDAVVIGSLEAAALSAQQHQWLKEFVDRRGGSLLLLAGRDGLGDGGWGRVPVAQVLPAALPGGAVSYGARVSRVRPTAYGLESAIGRFDADPVRNAAAWQALPPLADIQLLGALKPGAIVLLEAQSGERVDPLLVMQRFGRGAAWVLATATTWRWQMQLPLADQHHEQFWQRLLHQLAVSAPAQTSLTAVRSIQQDDAAATLEAEVLDEDFSPYRDVQLAVTALAGNGASVPAMVEPSGADDGRYTVRLQTPDAGLYRVELAASRNGSELARATAHLRREDGAQEQFAAWQHRALLERIAGQSGGRYWTLADLEQLPEAIRYSRAGMVERQTLDLWNIPLVFLLLAALKSAEWLLRRRWRRL
ncbi:MAG: hypothetical protein QM696_09290 [Steroidobacteraceae bacterium]